MQNKIIGIALAVATIVPMGVANASGYHRDLERAIIYTAVGAAVGVGTSAIINHSYGNGRYNRYDNDHYRRQMRIEESRRVQEEYDRALRERAAYQQGFNNGYHNGYNQHNYNNNNQSNVYYIPQPQKVYTKSICSTTSTIHISSASPKSNNIFKIKPLWLYFFIDINHEKGYYNCN